MDRVLSSPLAVLTAVLAALVFGAASVADQRSTKRVRRRKTLSPRIFVDLARQPLWLVAIGGTVLGFALQVLALSLGPLALVEPLLICDLIFATLISAYLRHRWDPVMIGGVVAAAVGVGAFLAIARPSTGQSSVAFLSVLPLGVVLTAAVAGCVLVGKRYQDLGPLAVALACGICFGVSALLVKLVVSNTGGGLAGMLTDWPIYALAIAGPLGFLLNENAFQQGTLISPVLAIITVCDPLISIALGYLWLNERLTDTPGAIAGEVVALLIMVVGIVVVAHRAPHVSPEPSQTAQRP